MAFIANAMVQRKIVIPLKIIAIGLFGSLILGYVIRPVAFVGQPFAIKFLAGGFIASLPLFFSGLLFSSSFKKVKDPARAFGARCILFSGTSFSSQDKQKVKYTVFVVK
jgi:hypothetical protein